MAGDPFGLLMRQRIVFLGGEVRFHDLISGPVEFLSGRDLWQTPNDLLLVQVNDFAADAIISQLLLLDSQDATKVLFSQNSSYCARTCAPKRSRNLHCAWPQNDLCSDISV